MAIFLTILKIIGITVLIILGLIISIVLLLLFVPLRYNASIVKGKDESGICATVKVTWLLHFLNVIIRYQKELYYRVRVILFTIKSSDKKSKDNIDKHSKKGKNSRKNSNNSVAKNDNGIENIENAENTENTDNSLKIEEVKTNETLVENIDYKLEGFDEPVKESDIDRESDTKDDLEEVIIEEDDLGFFQKLFIYLNKVFSLIKKIPKFIKKIKDKNLEFIDTVFYYINEIQDERNIEAVKLILNEISLVLKNIKPKKLKGNVCFGTDDPYQMGQVISYASILNPFIGENITFHPDFCNNVFECDICIKGRITLYVVLKAGFILYFNKEIKRLKSRLNREGK